MSKVTGKSKKVKGIQNNPDGRGERSREFCLLPFNFLLLYRRCRFEILLIGLFALHTFFFALCGIIAFNRMTVAGIDPVCYYGYLRSVLFDGDLDFDNEYRTLNPEGVLLGYPLTPIGRRPNGFSVGPAIAVAPFYIAAHIFIKATGCAPADGYSQPYQVSCFIGIAFYALAGLILLFRWLRLFFKPRIAFTAAALTWFASSAAYYAYPMTFMPHSISLFFVLVFMYYAQKTKGRLNLGRWVKIGILIGAMCLMRWQNVLFVLFLLPDFILAKKEAFRRSILPWDAVVALAIAFFTFTPQLVVWERLYGHFFTIPQGTLFLLWARPVFGKILFSTFNGLFTWTPITLIGIVGILVWMQNKDARPTAILLLILFALQLYLNSIVYDWHGSWGFGMRRFLNCAPIFAAGIGALLTTLRPRLRLAFPCAAIFLLVVWNYLFMVQYYLHLVAWNRPLTFQEIVLDKLHIYTSIQRRRMVNTAYESAERGYFDDVAKALELAIDLDPNHADIYFAAGRIAAAKGNIDLAYRFYKRALKIAPGDRDVLNAIKALRRQRDGLP